jgi:hypothetical protein
MLAIGCTGRRRCFRTVDHVNHKTGLTAAGAIVFVVVAATSAMAVNLGILDTDSPDRVGQLSVTASTVDPVHRSDAAPTSTSSTTTAPVPTSTTTTVTVAPSVDATTTTAVKPDDNGGAVDRDRRIEVGDDRADPSLDADDRDRDGDGGDDARRGSGNGGAGLRHHDRDRHDGRDDDD